MLVLHKGTDDDRVIQGHRSLTMSLFQMFNRHLHHYMQRGLPSDKLIYRNFGYNSAGLVNEINASGADIINFHWICNMLSVKDIARLRKPIVWTLHDMWAFCGGEHYVSDGNDARFRHGYLPENRPEGGTGPDLNRKTWGNKCRLWINQDFTIVCPSRWLADCALQSVLFANKSIHVVPNPLDLVNVWKPLDRNAARTVLGLPMDKKLVLFGAVGGVDDPRKGADLLFKAIGLAAEKLPGEMELMVYGQSQNGEVGAWPCPVHWLGDIRDDRVLVQAYSAADVMIVPSRQEAFGQAASEAQACGTPVVAFGIGGLSDIVTHCKTGWLAKAFDTANLAEGILWLLADDIRLTALSSAARKRAVARYSESVIARAYSELYDELMRQTFGS
jgi:glycosyltransferase involved in cell wall biosynthesis